MKLKNKAKVDEKSKDKKAPVKLERAIVGDYKGSPVLLFEPSKGENSPMLGLRKIKQVLLHLEEAKQFVESEGKEPTE